MVLGRPSPALPLFALTFALTSAGCDSADDHDHDHDASDCAAETRDDEFAIGLSKAGTTAAITFVAADPAPPALDDNTWTVVVSDLDGQPLADASITAVIPRMPDHGHGTPIEALVSATDNPGEFTISPVNLFMAGFWEISFDLELAGTSEQVVFGFCVE
jgi:hypothetical protein